MEQIQGIHHVTAIAGPAQENLDFYAGVLGLRLVKKSVNQDDPGTYHLFYADAEGHPGTDLTFFPWAQMAPSREGYGLSSEVSLAVPSGSLSFWSGRLERYGVKLGAVEERFGQHALPVIDPHGLNLALVESEDSLATAEPVQGGGGRRRVGRLG
jgi:glyoxalase family protein